MTRDIAESDWKRFRKLYEVVLERFCKQILTEVDRISADGAKSSHQRYLDIFKLLERRDKELADGFDNPRRSSALMQIITLHGRGLLTEDELNGFSEALVQVVKLLNGDRSTF